MVRKKIKAFERELQEKFENKSIHVDYAPQTKGGKEEFLQVSWEDGASPLTMSHFVNEFAKENGIKNKYYERELSKGFVKAIIKKMIDEHDADPSLFRVKLDEKNRTAISFDYVGDIETTKKMSDMIDSFEEVPQKVQNKLEKNKKEIGLEI